MKFDFNVCENIELVIDQSIYIYYCFFMSNQNLTEIQMRGEQLMRDANALTAFRAETAPYLGGWIAVSNDSWPTAWPTSLFTAIELYTDWADGYKARKGSAMRGVETTLQGALEDPRADKRFINSMLGGLSVRYLRQGDFFAAAMVGANLAATAVRDKAMNDDREFAVKNNLNPKAIPINKLKMDFQAVAVLALTTPFARRHRFKYASIGMMTVGTLVGNYGQRVFRKKLYAQLSEREPKYEITEGA